MGEKKEEKTSKAKDRIRAKDVTTSFKGAGTATQLLGKTENKKKKKTKRRRGLHGTNRGRGSERPRTVLRHLGREIFQNPNSGEGRSCCNNWKRGS